jgi:hypothetical protein
MASRVCEINFATKGKNSIMLKLRLPFLLLICDTFLCACLLWGALTWAMPAHAAPAQALGGNSTIISVTHLALGARDILSDPFRSVIYASLPSGVGAGGNRILPIEVPTGTLGTSLFVGSEPNHMALSDDGQYLYVGIDGASSVRRVNLISYTAEIQIPLGSSGFCGAQVAADIVVLQNNPQSIAVSKDRIECSPSHSGVTIYDGAVARPDSTPDHTGANVIEPSSFPSILYGYNNETTEYGLRTLEISPTGVMVSSVVESLVTGFGVDILFDNGLLYSTSGAVIDPQSMTLLGTYSGNGPIAPDSSQGVVYMVTYNYDNPYDTPYALTIFDQTEFTLLKSIPLSDISGSPKRLSLVDSRYLAMLTGSGDLYLMRLGEFVNQPPLFDSHPVEHAIDGIEYTYNMTSSDPNYGDISSITAPVIPSWLQFYQYNNSTGTLSGYPGLVNIGENAVELLATDRHGLTTTQRFTLTVVANPAYIAPTFTSAPALTATEANTYTYHVAARDKNEEDYLQISAPILPDWLQLAYLDSGASLLQGIPTHADVGAHIVNLMVTDNHGLTGTQQFTITVAGIANDVPPSFGSTPILGAVEGITYTYIVTASGADFGDLLVISAPVLPSWLSLSPLANGAASLSGVPGSDDIGEHALTLRVTNSQALADTQSFTLTVVGVGQVEGVLFEDANDNGTQDEGEAGIAGATVSLTPEAGSIATMAIQQAVITTTTSAQGNYQFSHVPTGSYTMNFDLPGSRPDPSSVLIAVTSKVPTVVLPVAVAPNVQLIYLPAIRMSKDSGSHTVSSDVPQAGE